MMRYPLAVRPQDEERWQEALYQARQYVRDREAALRAPGRANPSPRVFTGQLTPFQQEGLAFLLRTDRCLLADEMGLGKTVQALAMLAQLDAYPALIIAPAHLMRNWQSEILRFVRLKDGQLPTVHIVKGLTPYALPEADIYLMHYLLLRGWKETLPELGFRYVIFDEIQELRHSGTEKYSAASLLAEGADGWWA
jgi:SNF2 family DNA or RNA helicase